MRCGSSRPLDRMRRHRHHRQQNEQGRGRGTERGAGERRAGLARHPGQEKPGILAPKRAPRIRAAGMGACGKETDRQGAGTDSEIKTEIKTDPEVLVVVRVILEAEIAEGERRGFREGRIREGALIPQIVYVEDAPESVAIG